MTKLEQKLQELGYKYFACGTYTKLYNGHEISIELIVNRTKICGYYLETNTKQFIYQYKIDRLQQAFNEMQNDLEILKECEE